MKRAILKAWFGVLTAFALASCGGGGSAGGVGGGTTMAFGPFSTRAVTTGQPLQAVTASSSEGVFTGVAGGAFSSIVITPSPDMSQTRLLFSRNSFVYSMDPSGGDLHELSTDTPGDTNQSHPTWSPDRSKIAYSHLVDSFDQIFVANADGSSPKNISSGTAIEAWPNWCPTASKIVFYRFDTALGWNQIYTRNSDGTSITRISDRSANDWRPCWSPDGTKIAFSRNTGQYDRIFIMNANGTGVHALTSLDGITSQESPTWSPDGATITCQEVLSPDKYFIYSYSVDGLQQHLVEASQTDIIGSPSWSPDGHSIAYEAQVEGDYQIWSASPDGSGAHMLSSAPGSEDQTPSWSPFQQKRTLIGAGGGLGTSASGFVFGQVGFNVTSVLAFDSGTPDATTVNTSDTTPGAANVVFQISGALSGVKYFNGLGSTTTVLPSGSLTTATGALVSFDSLTGKIASVIPFSASRSQAPGRQWTGNGLVYSGTFLGVFGVDGRDIAPGGCKSIRIEAHTGIASVVR